MALIKTSWNKDFCPITVAGQQATHQAMTEEWHHYISDFVGQELEPDLAKWFIWSLSVGWHSQLADGLAWKTQDGGTHVWCLSGESWKASYAGTVEWGIYLWPTQWGSLRGLGLVAGLIQSRSKRTKQKQVGLFSHKLEVTWHCFLPARLLSLDQARSRRRRIRPWSFSFFPMLGTKPRASHLLCKCYISELFP